MGRKGVPVEEHRLQILLSPKALGITVREACRIAGWSKTQFYEFRKRYDAEGINGLRDRSSRPATCPHRTADVVEQHVCALRSAHPDWGPIRIRAELIRAGARSPAASTIGRILVRNGLLTPRPRKRRRFLRFERPCPNDLWQIDAIEFALGDRTPVHLINLLDDHARFLVSSRAAFQVDATAALEALEAAVAAHGWPREFLSDNARCFSGKNWGVVAALERRLWESGVNTIAASRRHPETIGKVERMHKTQRKWIEDLGPIVSLDELQNRADAFRWHYNQERPNQALGEATTPQERYEASEPAHPYGSRTRSTKRRVKDNGCISYSGWHINLTSEWSGAIVDVVEGGGKVRVSFRDELVTAFSIEEPKGYIGTGIRRGHHRLRRRVETA